MGYPKNRPVRYARYDENESSARVEAAVAAFIIYIMMFILIFVSSESISRTLTLYPESSLNNRIVSVSKSENFEDAVTVTYQIDKNLTTNIKVDNSLFVNLLEIDGELYLIPDDITPTETETRYTIGKTEKVRSARFSKITSWEEKTFLLIENITIVENFNQKEKLKPYVRDVHLQNAFSGQIKSTLIRKIHDLKKDKIYDIKYSSEDYTW